ncbi:MAG TPA: hypothetical protein VLJ62_05355 [Burkholderiaceae bacterium]|nr:hypothetical protein [Burkholderiaceae bacterium]
MSTLQEIQGLLGRIRTKRNHILAQVVALDRQAADEQDAQAADTLRQQIAGLRKQAGLLRGRELDGPARELSPQQFVDQLEGDLPILLAPLRVQTRFADSPDGRVLLIRVYPDDFSVQTHDAQLAAAERAAGDAYWAAPINKPDGQTQSRIELWRGMFATYGAPRASYIRQTTDLANAVAAALAPRQSAIWTLPERLVFRCIGLGGVLLGDEVVGAPIPDGLEAGFDPTQLAGGFTRPANDAGDYEVPPELAWQYDFDAAVKVGMAVRIPMQRLGNPRRIERIVVLGVRLSSDPNASADLLTRLVDDHRFTEGFEFVPQGTPTNVTHEGEVRAALDADALDALLSGPGSFDPPPSKTLYDAEPDGLRLARALGLDGNAFARVPFADRHDGSEAIAMKRALWAGTLGYYAQQMMAPLFEGLAQRADLGTAAERLLLKSRFFFTTFVFGRGPLPAIRVGNQPYGVLPVSADMLGPMTPGIAAWRDDFVDEFMAALHAKLQLLVPTWRDLARTQVATVAAGRIAEVLSLQASAVEYRASRLVGTEYLANYVDFKDKATADTEIPKFLALLDKRWADFNAQFAGLFGTQPRVFDLSHFGGLWRRILADVNTFDGALSPLLPGDVIDDLPLSESRPIGEAYPNYIAALSTLDFDAMRRGIARGDGKPMTALLYLLLRHSCLYEHAFTAMRLVHRANGTPWRAFREKEIVNVGYAFDATYWDLLERDGAVQIELPFFNVGLTPLALIQRRDEFRALLPWARDYLGDIDEVQHSLRLLADVPTARLERLFAEHLDLCSYRLDAWLTGFVYQRLLGHRLLNNPQVNPDGIHPLHASRDDNAPLRYDLNLRPLDGASRGLYLGAYGILEGLEADPRGVPVADLAAELRPKNGGVVTRDADNFGFIHAPSLNHAVTAAILRSGSVSEPDTAAFNINLSSSRTRHALWMIEGIRNGQLPAALLGYRFERGLRETDPALQQFLPALRFAFPMTRPVETQPDDPKEAIAAHDVVNGLTLVQAHRDGKLGAALAAVNPGLSAAAVLAVTALAGVLAELLDACADLMLAESVHQAAQGNFARAGAAVTSAGEFTHVPDRFDVVDTPRTGTTLTHRVLLAFDPAARAPGGADTPRARLAPALDAWLAALFGPLEQLQCVIAYRSDSGTPAAYDMALQAGATPALASFAITLDQLGLAAIDVLFLLDDAQGTELAQRADLLARPLFDAANPGAEPARIELQLFAPAPVGQRAVGELMPLASQLRRLLAQARSATRRDLLAPKMLHNESASRTALDSIDAEALRFAVLGTHAGGPELNPASLMLAAQAAADALAAIVPADTEGQIETLLLQAASFGMPEAVPTLARHPDRLGALRKQATRVQIALQARIDAAQAQAKPEALAADLLAACNDAAKTLLGTTLPLLPAIQMAEDLSSAALLPGAPDAQRVEDWLFAASLVRPGAERLQHTRVLAAVTGKPLEDLRLLQWPASAKSWIAEPPPAGEDWNDDRIAIALQPTMTLDLAQPLVGLVIDEWTELLPRTSETTGIAFHYDAPNAEPPQALLLAVSARSFDNHGRWQWRELVGCVEQAFDLARLRAVGPDELRKTPLDTVLPATMMAESAAPVTVSTSLFMLAATEIADSQAKLWSRT